MRIQETFDKPDDTFEIEVTQFIPLKFKVETITVWLPNKVKANYNKMLEDGKWLEMEILTTGHVSTTISDMKADHAFSITNNDDSVINGIIEMLKEYYPI